MYVSNKQILGVSYKTGYFDLEDNIALNGLPHPSVFCTEYQEANGNH